MSITGDRHAVSLVDEDVKKILSEFKQYKFIHNEKTGYGVKYDRLRCFVEQCILYCKHNNIIQKEGEK